MDSKYEVEVNVVLCSGVESVGRLQRRDFTVEGVSLISGAAEAER